MSDTIKTDLAPNGVFTITFNRPEKHHVMNGEMIAHLNDAAEKIRDDKNVRVVLFRSDGPSFCAGGDLKWMQKQIDADRATRIREATALARMLKAFYTMPKPVIARVQGNAFGGGMGIMAVSDIVIASSGLTFALTETRLGLIPATIGPFVMRRIGHGRTRSVFITSSDMDTTRARRLGLVSIEVDAKDLDATVEREIGFALRASPDAMARAKALLVSDGNDDIDGVIKRAIEALADSWETTETIEGIKAFFARKDPPWIK